MVGRDVDRIFPTIENESTTETLRVENLNSIDGSFENINFSVNKGEIFGIAGLVGAGRTELVRAICWADMITSGKIFVDNNVLSCSMLNSLK